MASVRSAENRTAIGETQAQLVHLETQANGIHRELLEQKGIAADAEGYNRGRVEGEVRAAGLLEGAALKARSGKPVPVDVKSMPKDKPIPVDVKSLPKK